MAVDRLQLADPAAAHEFARAQPLRVGAHHERFLDQHAGAVADLDQLRASAASSAIGFSHSTCLPASAALIDQGTCRWFGSGL